MIWWSSISEIALVLCVVQTVILQPTAADIYGPGNPQYPYLDYGVEYEKKILPDDPGNPPYLDYGMEYEKKNLRLGPDNPPYLDYGVEYDGRMSSLEENLLDQKDFFSGKTIKDREVNVIREIRKELDKLKVGQQRMMQIQYEKENQGRRSSHGRRGNFQEGLYSNANLLKAIKAQNQKQIQLQQRLYRLELQYEQFGEQVKDLIFHLKEEDEEIKERMMILFKMQRKAEEAKQTGKEDNSKEKETWEQNYSKRDSYDNESPKDMPVNILSASTKTEVTEEYPGNEEENESIIDYTDKQESKNVPANHLDGSVKDENEEQTNEELFRKEYEKQIGIKFEGDEEKETESQEEGISKAEAIDRVALSETEDHEEVSGNEDGPYLGPEFEEQPIENGNTGEEVGQVLEIKFEGQAEEEEDQSTESEDNEDVSGIEDQESKNVPANHLDGSVKDENDEQSNGELFRKEDEKKGEEEKETESQEESISKAEPIDREALSVSHSESSHEDGKKKQLTETEDHEEISGNEDGPHLRPEFDTQDTKSQEDNVSAIDSNDKETSKEMPVDLSVVSNKDENKEQAIENGNTGKEVGQVLEIKFEGQAEEEEDQSTENEDNEDVSVIEDPGSDYSLEGIKMERNNEPQYILNEEEEGFPTPATNYDFQNGDEDEDQPMVQQGRKQEMDTPELSESSKSKKIRKRITTLKEIQRKLDKAMVMSKEDKGDLEEKTIRHRNFIEKFFKE